MVYTFDSLGYAKRLRENGVPQNQAEAHAEAARDFVMAELVTKADLRAEIQAVRADLLALKEQLESRMENQTLRLTVWLGAMQVVLIGVLATILKLV
jgi:maltooligosyltrehalose synthase